MTWRQLFQLGSFFCLTAVALGAFGAHFLKFRLSLAELNTFETAVRYQIYHGFALCITAILYERIPRPLFRLAGGLFILGLVIFSGSLYALLASGARSLGMITPVGGLLLIGAWLVLIIGVQQRDE